MHRLATSSASIRLPREFVSKELSGQSTAKQIFEWLDARCHELAGRFDRRNGNDAFSQSLGAALSPAKSPTQSTFPRPANSPVAERQVAPTILAREEEGAAASPLAHRRRRPQAPSLVYVVEDEQALSDLYKSILEPNGYDVSTFRDRELAWKTFLAADPRPDLLITDYIGFPITAEELIKRFRQLRPELKVLMVSGYPITELSQNQLVKPDGFLAKPHRPEELLEHVALLMCKPLKQAQTRRQHQARSTVG
jgi:CheY-like chemotaxis protein